MAGLLRNERPADGVVLVTLNRPDRRNALSTALRQEANLLLTELAGDETVRTKAEIVRLSGVTEAGTLDL